MTVGILLITHADLGRCLLQAARSILAAEPALAEAIDVPVDIEPDEAFDQALAACRRLDRGDGVMVLTDLYGSTPSNIANRLEGHHNVQVLAGVNLPMLVRALNYRASPLGELADKALHGARDGVVLSKGEEVS
jgi:PTS system ascorbate-specific IIA component